MGVKFMECYYHPDREGTDTCAICGKSICKECGLEIAGKEYCKECLEKIVGLGIENKSKEQPQSVVSQEPVKTEPARLNKKPVEENIYQPPAEEEIYAPQKEVQPTHEIKQIPEDSPYNIKKDIAYSGGLESSYIQENEPIPQMIEETPKITQNEYIAPNTNSQEFIYPDHSYKPQPTSARIELEDKYEKYLDDLYFDENDVPLGEQLAKDEEKYGSLTRRQYRPKSEEPILKEKTAKKPNRPETPEEMEARIRAEILAEQQGGKKSKRDKKGKDNIHNLNYQEEKEPMGIVDILLTIILILVVLIVIYYLIYIFTLSTYYSTFIDAIYALSNPQNVINNILSPQ